MDDDADDGFISRRTEQLVANELNIRTEGLVIAVDDSRW